MISRTDTHFYRAEEPLYIEYLGLAIAALERGLELAGLAVPLVEGESWVPEIPNLDSFYAAITLANNYITRARHELQGAEVEKYVAHLAKAQKYLIGYENMPATNIKNLLERCRSYVYDIYTYNPDDFQVEFTVDVFNEFNSRYTHFLGTYMGAIKRAYDLGRISQEKRDALVVPRNSIPMIAIEHG